MKSKDKTGGGSTLGASLTRNAAAGSHTVDPSRERPTSAGARVAGGGAMRSGTALAARSRPGQLTLRQIEIFHAVMVTGSLSEAGRLLHVTQPVVSRALGAIEQRLGFPLFDRVKSRLYPNAEARVLFDGVAGIQEGVARVNDIAFRLAFEGTGTLRVVSSPSLGEWLVPAALLRLAETHPDVRVRFRPMSMDILAPYMLSGQADIAILSVPLQHPNIAAREIRCGQIVCAIPADHRLAQPRPTGRPTDKARAAAADRTGSALGEPVTAEMLAECRLIGYALNTPFNDRLAAFWKGGAPQPHIEVRSPVSALSMVRRGLGVALVDAFCVDPALMDGIVVRPIAPSIPLSLHVVHPGNQPLSLTSRAFVAAFESVLTGIPGDTSAS